MNESSQESAAGAVRALLRRCVRLRRTNFDWLAARYLERRRRGAQVGSTVDVESVISLVAAEIVRRGGEVLERSKILEQQRRHQP